VEVLEFLSDAIDRSVFLNFNPLALLLYTTMSELPGDTHGLGFLWQPLELKTCKFPGFGS
jgi:hypothetical protein